MVQPKNCPICTIWAIRPEDNYCSWCGHRFVSFNVELRPNRFVQDEIPPPADLIISNGSNQHEVVIQRIDCSESWVSVAEKDGIFPFSLHPGSKRVLAVEVDPLDLPEDYHQAILTVVSNAGLSEVTVEVAPSPVLQVVTGEYTIFVDNRDLEQNLAHVKIEKGSIVLDRISAKPAEWVSIAPAGGRSLPIRMDARYESSLDLQILIDEAYLLEQTQTYPQTFDCELTLHCGEFDRTEPFTFHCWKPPQLYIWEETDPIIRVYAGKRGILTLSLQNLELGDAAKGAGNAVLEIRRLAIFNEDGTENRWLKPTEPLPEVLQIEGGKLSQIRFEFATEGVGSATQTVPRGQHTVVFVLGTNMPDGDRRVRFEISVETIKVFKGILAVDFGTSNTCCAAFADFAEDFEVLSIDSKAHNLNPTTTPTVIQYCNISDTGDKLVNIGALVDSLYLDPRVAASTVRSPKLKLGCTREEDQFDIRFADNIEKRMRCSAREVVADYLLKVRSIAEERVQRRFTRLVITHPSRFRIQQLRDLEAAVRTAFGENCDLTLLQEPMAAALNFVVSSDALALDSYRLAVFDFGGGTSDITLLDVRNIRSNGFLQVCPTLLASTGAWFGGEDLTAFIMEAGLTRFRELCAELRPHSQIVIAPREVLDPNLRWLASVNRSRLRAWAEQTKFLLVRYGDDHLQRLPHFPDILPNLKLNVFIPGHTEEVAFPHTQIVPQASVFEAYLRNQLMSLAADMAVLVSKAVEGKLDHILLSGKSSAIPLVRKVFEEEFPGAIVTLAPEPKECVVSGACVREKFKDGEIVLVLPGDSSTTTRIGIQTPGPNGAYFFREVLAAGMPIPEDGLSGFLEYPLRRHTVIRVLENSGVGVDDPIYIKGKQSPSISVLDDYKLDVVPQIFPSSGVMPCRLELKISPNQELSIRAHMPGIEQPLVFVPETENA